MWFAGGGVWPVLVWGPLLGSEARPPQVPWVILRRGVKENSGQTGLEKEIFPTPGPDLKKKYRALSCLV